MPQAACFMGRVASRIHRRETLGARWAAIVVAIGWCFIPASHSFAQGLVPQSHHGWGKFPAGSWKRVRVVTETLDEQGQPMNTSTSETKTTLARVDEREYTLLNEVSIEVAGKRFDAQPQEVTQGYSGESPGQAVTVKQQGTEEIEIDGRRVPCEVRQAVVNGDASRRVSTVHYSPDVAPHTFRRATTSTDLQGETTNFTTEVTVVATNMPFRVGDEVISTTHVKTIHKHAGGTTITLEIHCDGVPGCVVSHTSKELDPQGRLLNRSTLELIDYSVAEPKQNSETRRGLLRGRRERRAAG